MKRSLPITTLNPEFEKFLYSPLGDETPSSVLSALARQDLDPWEEAGHLARMPRASAVLRLTPMISAVTKGSSAALARDTAARLVALLPQPNVLGIGPVDLSAHPALGDFASIIPWLIVGAIILAASLLIY